MFRTTQMRNVRHANQLITPTMVWWLLKRHCVLAYIASLFESLVAVCGISAFVVRQTQLHPSLASAVVARVIVFFHLNASDPHYV